MVRACMTLDKATLAMIDAAADRLDLDRSKTCRVIIEQAHKDDGEITLKQLREFYRDIWAVLDESSETKKIVRLDWPEEHDRILLQIAPDVLGKPNKSEMFRLLVMYYAVSHNIADITYEMVRVAHLSL